MLEVAFEAPDPLVPGQSNVDSVPPVSAKGPQSSSSPPDEREEEGSLGGSKAS